MHTCNKLTLENNIEFYTTTKKQKIYFFQQIQHKGKNYFTDTFLLMKRRNTTAKTQI